MQQIHVHTEITGGVGDGSLELRLVRLRTGEVVYSQRHEISFPDRTDILSLFFELRRVKFPAQDYYSVELLVDDTLVVGAKRRLDVVKESKK